MYKLWNTYTSFYACINDLSLFTFRMVALNNTKDRLKWTFVNTIKII